MKTDLHYFDIWPRVFPAGTPVEVTIKPLTGQREFPGFENRPYRIELLPLCERNWSHNDAPSVFRNIYVTPGSD
ncbi:MAG: hypothetical protein ACI4XQ_05510, partial [Eubacteriales bacterium]